MSAVKLPYSSFNNANFNSCKLIGINWAQVKWPYIALVAPIAFNDCDISLSSFFELKLSELILTNSKAHDVDFRGCELIGADFSGTDFEKSQFMKTTLKNADFANASNYNINPTENNISKARFSFPDVCNLLQTFDIKIEGVYED